MFAPDRIARVDREQSVFTIQGTPAQRGGEDTVYMCILIYIVRLYLVLSSLNSGAAEAHTN